MPMDGAIMDYVVLGLQGEETDLDRALIVAHKEMISRYSSVLHAEGLRRQGIDVKMLSLV
jgi:Tfp pilus assembly PilM family ATPase